MARQPYENIRVLDISQGIAGPSCASILGQWGARVIKVEPPSGDWGRLIGGGHDGETAVSIASNFGKRSVCIDANNARGREAVLRLARASDVLIESFRPGVVDRLGLSYAAVSRENPSVIYASITGFGPDGPYVEKPGTDSVLQALTGMMLMNQDEHGKPRRVGMLLVDAASAVYAAQAIGAALYSRTVDGAGRHIQIPLMQACAALQAIPILDDFIHAGRARPPVTVPSGTFATADGLLNLVSIRNEMFFNLCRVIGRTDWIESPSFATNEARLHNAAEINAGIAEALRRETSAYWIDRFERHDVLCAPVKSYADFLSDVHTRHAGFFGQASQPQFGSLPIALAPGSEKREHLPSAPKLGGHTTAVLEEIGYTAAEIKALAAVGTVKQG
jgi:crotonobetainyl-CoA:carnitine CoA-transferase CaiB-like acyl-CoA transferase